MFSSLSLWFVLPIFAASAGVIWIAGVHLSGATDVLSERLGLGQALGGLLFLAVATNLPEIAITVTAALRNELGIAVGNLLGGIAVQTVVLAVLDAVGVKESKPLTYLAASLVLVLEGTLVVALLFVVVSGTELPSSLVYGRLEPASVLIVIIWGIGVWLVGRARRGLPWHNSGHAPGGQAPASASPATRPPKESPRRAAVVFAAGSAATLVAGVTIEQSGERIAALIGMSGVIFGATILAGATSLPEISTGLASVKLGDYRLSISDIFGGNAFLPVLFFVATVLSGHSVLPHAAKTDVYLTALGGVLTLVYIVGLIFRPQRRVLRLGLDSLVVVVLYAVGLAGLVAVAHG